MTSIEEKSYKVLSLDDFSWEYSWTKLSEIQWAVDIFYSAQWPKLKKKTVRDFALAASF